MMFPSLFLSHGAPTLPLTDTPARTFLTALGERLARPTAIVVISAHWETESPVVSAVAHNPTIHDFYGFPRRLYELRYPAPGAPALAAEIAELLRAAGLGCALDNGRGLDHGAWGPLMLMYPRADIPVLQVSIQPHLGPAHHLRLGGALQKLRDKGVLIIGSGSFTHDLSEFRSQNMDAPVPDWVDGFGEWFSDALVTGRTEDLLDYRQKAPFARKNHPTEEHLLPLFASLGAAGANWRAEQLHTSATYGILRMDVYAFSAAIESHEAGFDKHRVSRRGIDIEKDPQGRPTGKLFGISAPFSALVARIAASVDQEERKSSLIDFFKALNAPGVTVIGEAPMPEAFRGFLPGRT
jgi:4,5-DOPA dioxygenase extradiol